MATAPCYYPRSEPVTFRQDGDFAAVIAAEKALHDAGFSIGSSQKGAPRGILLGDVSIAKWRNLSSQERMMLDGEMHGGREGPVTITPSAVADDDVLAALERVRAACELEPVRFTKLVGGCVTDA